MSLHNKLSAAFHITLAFTHTWLHFVNHLIMEYKYRFVSITTYAKLSKISREAVYKRIKSGAATLFELSEQPLIDLAFSKGVDQRNNWKEIMEPDKLPF